MNQSHQSIAPPVFPIPTPGYTTGQPSIGGSYGNQYYCVTPGKPGCRPLTKPVPLKSDCAGAMHATTGCDTHTIDQAAAPIEGTASLDFGFLFAALLAVLSRK